MLRIDNPDNLPEIQRIERIEEPYVYASIMVPKDYVGTIMELAQDRRAIFLDMEYIAGNPG